MHPFVQTVSHAGGILTAVVISVMVLTLFYRGLSWLSGSSKPDTIAVRGVLKKGTLATVHVAGQKTFEQVRFVGFTNTDSLKTQLPFELNGLVILEDEAGIRYLIRAKDIRMIVVPPEARQK